MSSPSPSRLVQGLDAGPWRTLEDAVPTMHAIAVRTLTHCHGPHVAKHADDLAADVMIRVLRRFAVPSDGITMGHAIGYVRAVARSVALDHLRNARKRFPKHAKYTQEAAASYMREASEEGGRSLEALHHADVISYAIRTLPMRPRNAVRFLLEGLSLKAAAERAGIAPNQFARDLRALGDVLKIRGTYP